MNARRFVDALALLGLAACSSTKGAANMQPSTAGTVPADMRDVERDGEGLVVTTFGAYPDRVPDWVRAGSVLALLKQVWARSKVANPGLPAVQVKAIDDAIATLDQAIGAKDQAAAAYASNSVGLAVPELFDFFHPDAPIGVVRMDAMFRQVGLDGHFQHFDGVATDIASLKSDWGSTKSRVDQRVPTCHRVGGTATVSGDIDQSLANVDQAIGMSDTKVIEQESENGATEIDTLELLFDCPAGTTAPPQGLGAACSSSAPCDTGQVCDPSNGGGRCAPDPANAKIGTQCNSTIDCGSNDRSACNTAAGDNYPGGYCAMEPCDDVQVCPPGATCVALGGETPGCFKTCATDADCRAGEGYVCQLFVTMPPIGFGPSDHACAFPCTRDADCQKPLTCDVASGKCKP